MYISIIFAYLRRHNHLLSHVVFCCICTPLMTTQQELFWLSLNTQALARLALCEESSSASCFYRAKVNMRISAHLNTFFSLRHRLFAWAESGGRWGLGELIGPEHSAWSPSNSLDRETNRAAQRETIIKRDLWHQILCGMNLMQTHLSKQSPLCCFLALFFFLACFRFFLHLSTQ